MSVLFTPKKMGNTEIKNRFVRTPTYEGRAKRDAFSFDTPVFIFL